MNSIGEQLSAQHEELDRLLAQAAGAAHAKYWDGYRRRLATLREALIEHMAYEEEELFPALEALSRAEREALVEQHEQLRMLLDTLHAASPQHDPEGCIAELERLTAFQNEHHAREQAACYAMSAGARAAHPPAMPSGPPPLDLRGLQPPEPIVRIFEALERAPREPLRAILPHEPVPLYGLLRERGFSYTGSLRPDGGYELLIEGDS